MGFVICKYNKKQTKKHRVKCKKAKVVMNNNANLQRSLLKDLKSK